MEMILSFVAGMLLAGIIAYILLRQTKHAANQQLQEALSVAEQQSSLKVQAATSALQARLDAQLRHEQDDRAAREAREEAAKTEREAQTRQQLQLLQSQFLETSQRLIRERSEEMSKANSENMGKLLSPLQQEMENVRKLMGETRSANDTSTSSLKGALEEMIRHTEKISQEANNLADALKNRGKVHGDWGEQVLEDILEGSGLVRDQEYFCQMSFKGDHGNELRPDVVVNSADGKRVIVDSKVSLTAYADALGAQSDEEREAAIRRNYDSVKKHVRELSDKQYPKYVEGALNHVLMFVPNEGAYVMAMNYDHSLAQDAFRQGVVIVNPTNLMLTLHLVLQTWQQSRQKDNCQKILDAANGMYDKVMGLVDTCSRLGAQLDTAHNTYREAMKQLSDGQGNVLRRVESLKELGITSTKRAKLRATGVSMEEEK